MGISCLQEKIAGELVDWQASNSISREAWSCVTDQAAAVMQASDAKKVEQAGSNIFGEPISPEDARPRSVMGGVRKPPGAVATMSGTQCNIHVERRAVPVARSMHNHVRW